MVRSLHSNRICDCGSGLESEWYYDARCIPLCRACKTCWKQKRLRYRPEVLTDPNYEADEPIEPDINDSVEQYPSWPWEG
jgi:hypothetical protein